MSNNNNSEIEYYNLIDNLDKDITNIWNTIMVPYLESQNNILDLDKNDINKFKLFFYNSSKYSKYLDNNI